jgi:Rieske Fe-S protein
MTERTRRAVLAGAAGVGAVAVVSACGGGNDAAQPGATTGAPTTGGQPTPAATTGGTSSGFLAKTSDVPVGGGKIVKEQDTVITQPVAGTFKGFGGTCQHMGCPLANVEGGTINCNCHGSKYSIEDGSVKNGPATKGLPTKAIKVDGDSINLA